MTTQTDSALTLGQYTGVLRRRWPYLAIIVPPAILISAVLAITLPAVYSSSATILLEASSIDPSLVKTTVVSYADQRIEIVRRDVMSGARLEQVVKQVDPYPDLTDLSLREKAIQITNDTTIVKVDPVTLEPLVASSAFSINYSNRSPELAARVAQILADMFLTSNRETRTAQAVDTYNFMLTKSRELETQIRSVEQRIAEFKGRYGNALPEAMQRNESGMDRAQLELDSVKAQIRLVEQQESLFKLQLSQISPTMITSKGSDLFTQLGLLRAQLAEAQQKYTPDHPDVKRLTRAIEALAAQAKLGNPNNVRPDNPDYLRVSAELEAVRSNLAALRSNVARSQSQIGQYEQRLAATPRVEQSYVQLTRDRESLQQQFELTREKLREAEMSRSLESQAKGERYTLIRQPIIPRRPDSPNRLGIVLLGMLLGLGVAVAMATIKDSTDATVRDADDATGLTNVPLIAAIPTLLTTEMRSRQRRAWGSLAGVYLVVTVVVGLLIAF
jgi:polysaccharide biosynthesis transport protein